MRKLKKDLALGKRVKEVRERLGLTQSTLGEKLGVSRGVVSQWEIGFPVSRHYLMEMAAVSNCNWAWLSEGAGDADIPREERIIENRKNHLREKDGLVAEPETPRYGSPPGQITMAQAMEAIATQLALPVEKVREAVTGLLKSENETPKKKG